MRNRYKAGDRYESKGFAVWCENGRKSPNDLRVMMSAPFGGGPIPDVIMALALDMLFETEDIARERPAYSGLKHFKGWRKMSQFCHDLYKLGPDAALAKLYAEHEVELPLFIEVNENGEA